jgi:hypothetical protein
LALFFVAIAAPATAVKPWACRKVCNYIPIQPEPTYCDLDCPADECLPQQADIRGELLVLALGSQGYAGE